MCYTYYHDICYQNVRSMLPLYHCTTYFKLYIELTVICGYVLVNVLMLIAVLSNLIGANSLDSSDCFQAFTSKHTTILL